MSNSDTEHVIFIIIILLACNLWTHKAINLQVEHIIRYVVLFIAAVIIIVAILRIVKKLKYLHGRSYPDLEKIDTMTGLEFERYVAKLLKAHGYSHIKLTEEYDYGIDIVAINNGITWGIQVKRYPGLVGADAVRQAVTALRFYHCDKAMVITNSTFSCPAITLADANDCVLIDESRLNVML